MLTNTHSHKFDTITTWAYKLLFLSCAFYILILPFSSHAASLIIRIPTIALMMLIGFIYFSCYSYKFTDLFCTSCITLIICVSYLYTPQYTSWEGIYHNISFIAFTLLIASSNIIPVTKSLLKFIYVLSVIIALLLFLYSFTFIAHFNGQTYVESLTLGFNNPNLTGLLLFLVASLIMITRTSQRYKIPSFIIFGLLVYLTIQTDSRTSLLSILCLPLFSIYKYRKPFPWYLIIGFFLLSLCFVPTYLWLYNNHPNFIFLGKPFFSGREELFVYVFQQAHSSSWLIGNASQFGFDNAHNAPLAIFLTIGLIGLFCFYFIFLRKLLILNSRVSNATSNMAVFVLLVCLLHSCAEAACFNGSFPIAIFIYTFFVLAHCSKLSDTTTTYKQYKERL